jgi:hypothetical protein
LLTGAKFAIASAISLSSNVSLEHLDNFTYFEKAKEKIVAIIDSVNNGNAPQEQDYKLLSYFNKIGRNLLDDESIDFGYNHTLNLNSNAILNKTTRKKLLLSSEQITEYIGSINYPYLPFSLKLTAIFNLNGTKKTRMSQ